MFEKLRDAAASTADLSAIIRTRSLQRRRQRARPAASSQVDGGPVRVALVSGNYFSTLGTVAAMGRTLAPDDDRPSGAPVVVVSDDYWSRRLGKSAAILGRTLTFGDTAYDIVGVAASRGFLGSGSAGLLTSGSRSSGSRRS